jgi:hypothetical protein
MFAVPHCPGLANPNYGASDHEWSDEELDQAVLEALRAAGADPEAGIKLVAEDNETRELLRGTLLTYLNGDFAEVQNSPEHGWWQVVLLNGAIIRVTGS